MMSRVQGRAIGAAVLFSICITVTTMLHAADRWQAVTVGTPREEIYTCLDLSAQVTSRTASGEREWITFLVGRGGSRALVTFLLRQGRVRSWRINDRQEVVREYLSEFCSQAIIQRYPFLYQGIRRVLMRLPLDVFLQVTDRTRPVLFTEYYPAGPSRYANSADIYPLPGDPPTFTDGIWLIKLNTDLDAARDARAVSGVIAHEIAHRMLEHSREEEYSTDLERRANALAGSWGFARDIERARGIFNK